MVARDGSEQKLHPAKSVDRHDFASFGSHTNGIRVEPYVVKKRKQPAVPTATGRVRTVGSHDFCGTIKQCILQL